VEPLQLRGQLPGQLHRPLRLLFPRLLLEADLQGHREFFKENWRAILNITVTGLQSVAVRRSSMCGTRLLRVRHHQRRPRHGRQRCRSRLYHGCSLPGGRQKYGRQFRGQGGRSRSRRVPVSRSVGWSLRSGCSVSSCRSCGDSIWSRWRVGLRRPRQRGNRWELCKWSGDRRLRIPLQRLRREVALHDNRDRQRPFLWQPSPAFSVRPDGA
jgi:hypothetical protein